MQTTPIPTEPRQRLWHGGGNCFAAPIPARPRQRLWLLLLVAGLLCTTSCGGGGTSNGTPAGTPVAGPTASNPALITITAPSAAETVLGEKRDFYVTGTFPSTVQRPGDIRVDLVRLDGSFPPSATRVRTVQSHVDATGTTPLSAIRADYPNGRNVGGMNPLMVPDLVQEPGGFLYPGNKVAVGSTWFTGLILGGATKDFDTSYTDENGRPLQDLLQGDYEVRVSGLSGDLKGAYASLPVSFRKSHVLLGRFFGESFDDLQAYAAANHLRLYLDSFAGYFTYDGGRTKYIIDARWSAQNSLEVVNTLPGIVDANVQDSENHLLVYSVAERNATQSVEIGAMVANDLTEAPSTEWLRYDIGEPSVSYVDRATTQNVRQVGRIVPFGAGRKMAMVRYEVKSQVAQPAPEENIWRQADTVPKSVGTDFASPLAAATTDRLELFGVCRPIASTAIPGTGLNRWFYSVTRRITNVHYIVTGPLGGVVEDSTRDVSLQRYFGRPDDPLPCLYEYKHELVFNAGAGAYSVVFVAVDSMGAELPETRASFTVNVN